MRPLTSETSSHDARLNETNREGPNDTSCNGADTPNPRGAPHKDCCQHRQQIAVSDCAVKVVIDQNRQNTHHPRTAPHIHEPTDFAQPHLNPPPLTLSP